MYFFIFLASYLCLFEGADDCQASRLFWLPSFRWFRITFDLMQNSAAVCAVLSWLCTKSLLSSQTWLGGLHLHFCGWATGSNSYWLGGCTCIFFRGMSLSDSIEERWVNVLVTLPRMSYKEEKWDVYVGNPGSWTLSLLHGCRLDVSYSPLSVMAAVLGHSSHPVIVSLLNLFRNFCTWVYEGTRMGPKTIPS